MSLGARIVIAIFAGLFGLMIALHGTTADADKAWFSYGLGAFCFSIAAACVLRGRAARFLGSVVGAGVFVLGVSYLGHELMAGPFWSGRRSQPSVFNAAMFMLVFGLPGAGYAFHARFGFGKRHPPQPLD